MSSLEYVLLVYILILMVSSGYI